MFKDKKVQYPAETASRCSLARSRKFLPVFCTLLRQMSKLSSGSNI
jgi:hypothetical protein